MRTWVSDEALVRVKLLAEVVKVDTRPYLSLERNSRYLYTVTFMNLPDDTGVDSVPGKCSSYVQNGKLYRNLDFNYDNKATFHIILPGIDGISFINGLTDTSLNDGLIAQLPYHITDGVNEHGIMVSTHVLYNDWDARGTGSIPLTKLPYLALKNIKSMETLEEDLGGVLTDMYIPQAMVDTEYLLQVLVTDGINTVILTPAEDSVMRYVAVDATSNPKLANFKWVEDETVERADLQRRPTGVERWNMMPCNLKDLRFTKAYEEPSRLSEFIGIGGTTKDSSDTELAEIYNRAHAAYEKRTRDGTMWQTMHSVVYSPRGIEHLWIQEDWDRDYAAGRTAGEHLY